MLFSLSGLGLSFQSSYTVQDDARQHVFWLQRLNDSELFPNDLIADYFSSVAPAGYKFLYWLANLLGLEPFLFNKILPLLLGVGTSIYIYLVTIEIFSLPLAGFLASLLLNQNLWLLNDLVSGTPRAFFYVLFLGFIYYLLRRELYPCLLLIVLQGLFYPQAVIISAGILILNILTQRDKFYVISLATAVLILAIYKLQTGEFTDVITLEAAKQLPEFYPGGRSAFFTDEPWYFWLFAERSGFFPFEWQYFALCSFWLLLLICLIPRRLSLIGQINRRAAIIWQILLASFGSFCLAHLMLFRLHLPSRYSQHTWRIVLALIGGIVLAVFLQHLRQRLANFARIYQWLAIAIFIAIVFYPTIEVQSRPDRLSYLTGETPELYQFLQQQPKDVVIATLGVEADFIPSLARRSVLVSREYSIPYHWDYYSQIRQRTKDLIRAQYSSSLVDVQQFIRKYQVDLWLLNRQAFTAEYLYTNSWLNQFPLEIKTAIASLQNSQPAIISQSDRCSIWQTSELNLLDAKCLLEEEKK